MNSDLESPKFSTTKKLLIGILGGAAISALAVYGTIEFANAFDKNMDCSQECASNTPVCGQDGFWYANPCLATCANTRMARSELHCSGSPAMSSPATAANMADLVGRHNEKGFKFVGMIDESSMETLQPSSSKNSEFTTEMGSSSNLRSKINSEPTESVKGAWLVIDEDGAAYVKEESDVDNNLSIEQQFQVESDYFSGSSVGCPGGQSMNLDNYITTTLPSVQSITNSRLSPAAVSPPSFAHQEEPVVMETETHDNIEGSDRRLAVIGPDSRYQIFNAHNAPHKYIGHLTPIGCTGTLIGPSQVITAGHCLWGRVKGMDGVQNGRWRSSDNFYAGRVSEKNYLAHAKVVRKIIHRNYRNIDAYEFDWDYGIAILNKPVGAKLGWMGVGYDCSTSAQSKPIQMTVAGFPADKPWFSMWESKCQSVFTNCGWNSISHSCDTYGGMSGSSMYETGVSSIKSVGGAPIVRAIHVAGSSSSNIATLVQRNVFQAVKEWRGADACPLPLSRATATEQQASIAEESSNNISVLDSNGSSVEEMKIEIADMTGRI